MKNLQTLFILFTVLLLAKCTTSVKTGNFTELTFEKVDSLVLKFPYQINVWASFDICLFNRKDTTYLLFADFDNHSLIEVNIETGNSNTFEIKELLNDKYPTFNFKPTDEESILIYREINNTRRLHDSVLFTIDYEGNTIDYFNLDSTNLKVSNNTTDSTTLTYYSQLVPWNVFKNRLIFNPASVYGSKASLRMQRNGEIPVLCEIAFLENNKVRYLPLDFKLEKASEQYYSSSQLPFDVVQLDKDNIIIGPRRTSKLFNFDLTTQTITKEIDDSLLIPQALPLKNFDKSKSLPSVNQFSSIFRNMVYDSLSGRILRFGSYPVEEEVKLGDYWEYLGKKEWIGLYSKDLNLLGQGLKPSWLRTSSPRPVFYQGQLISFYQNEDDRTTIKVFFSQIKLKEVGKEGKEALKNKITAIKPSQSGGIATFFGSRNLKPNSKILLIPSRSCPACVDYSLSYYLQNRKRLEREGVYLVSDNRRILDKLENKVSQYIIIDSKRAIQNMLSTSVNNPTLMFWDGEKVTKTIILDPKEVYNIDKYLELL